MSEKKMPGFVTVDTSKIEERLAEDKPFRGSRTPAVWITFGNGDEYEVRILPPYTTEGSNAFLPYMKIFQHWDVGPDGKRVICPYLMSDKKESCYVCEQVSALFKTGDKADAKRAKRMRAGQSFIYQVIDRSDPIWLETDDAVKENPELIGRPKIKFMRLPYAGHSQLLGYYNDPDYGDLSHHLTGIDVKVKRTGEGLDTEYSIKTKRDNTPMFGEVGDPDMEAMLMVLEDLYQLDKHPFFRVPEYDETAAIFMGEETSREETSSLSSGRSQSSGMLPAPTKKSLEQWIEDAQGTWIDGKKGIARTRKEVANAYNVSEAQISDCYSEATDHEIQGCQECPIRVPCAYTYFTKYNRWSESQPEEAPKPKVPAGGIIGRSVAAPSPTSMRRVPDNSPAVVADDNDVAAMTEYLSSELDD